MFNAQPSSLLLLAQEAAPAMPWGTLDPRLLGALALLLLALVVLLARWSRHRARRSAAVAPPPVLPPPRVELPLSDAERARREDADRARQEAERLAQERLRLEAE